MEYIFVIAASEKLQPSNEVLVSVPMLLVLLLHEDQKEQAEEEGSQG